MQIRIKRFARVVFALAIALMMSVVGLSAGAPPPYSVIEDGKTVVRTFKISGLSAESKQRFEDILVSPRSVFVALPDGTYHFFIVPDGGSISISDGSSPQTIKFSFTSGFIALKFQRSGEYFVPVDGETVGGNVLTTSCIVGGNYWKTYNFPTLSYDYLADITGALVIETDEGQGGGDSGGGILDWLTGFWTKFVEVLKSIFIPSPDYFSKFFADIKNAFDAKLGGIGGLLDSLSSSISGLKAIDGNSSLVIKLPDNFLFSGYDGLSVDVFKHLSPLILFIRNIFNAFLVVMTVIICYRKAIEIVNS